LLDELLLKSNSPDRKRPVSGNSGDFVQAVFRPEIFWILRMISGRFLSESTGSWQESTGQFPAGILLSCSSVFLQDPVAGIVVLGS
jgi:hypothetical protein